ncbi:transcriptional regulator [Deinococcus piscis]|uniref:Transcriptional regulator n=1 Tax=Deinococcus piscis TaxID=394230 RepID=A0ABQ3JZU2_9DEIO|nr:helix-turn-helix domain-containing protein [Deinococcus piscis]GHF95723.1 transcriptional regulator [Deinococcus piscis]
MTPPPSLPEHPAEFCPVYHAIGILQEKWVLHIIRVLLQQEMGFNELARAVGGCNSATLTQRLEHLERLGIVSKRLEDGPTRLGRSVYALTPAGRELQVVIDAIGNWALAHLPASNPSLSSTDAPR